MKRKFKFKNLFLISFVAVAGLFGVCTAEFVKDTDVIEAKADDGAIYETVNGVEYRIIYYHSHSTWETGNYFNYHSTSDSHCYQYTCDGSNYTLDYFDKGSAGDSHFSEIIGDFAAKIYLPKDVQTIRFQSSKDLDGSRPMQRETDEITLTSTDCGFVITTNRWNSVWPYGDAGYQTATPKTYDEFMAYFHTNYFSITSGWNGGDGGIASSWIYCQSTFSSTRDIARATPITSNMIRQFSSGKYYAKFLVPTDSGSYVNMQNSFSPGASLTARCGDQTTLYNNYMYTVTTNSSTSRQSISYYPFSLDSDYYIVGSGSFANGTEWSTSSGVRMDSSLGDKGILMNQYFEAGDTFKITNGTDWYGWNSNDASTDKTNFNHTSFKNSDGTSYRLYFSVENLKSWWHTNNENNTYAYIFNSDSDKAAAWPGLKMTRYGTTDYYYVDITDDKLYSYVIFNDNGTNQSDGNCAMPNMIDKDCYWALNEWPSSGHFKLNEGAYCEYDNKVINDNIRVKTSGYYNIYFNSSYNIYIEPSLSEEVYLDLNSVNWEEYDHKIGAYFWNTASPSTVRCVEMTLVNGHGGSTRIFEAIVPYVGSNVPNRVIFYSYTNFYESSMGTMGTDWHKKTGDLSATGGQNKYKLTDWDSGDNVCPGTWNGVITNEMRANYFGNYFQNNVGCVQVGTSEPTGDWSLFETEYNNMHTDIQGIVWLANANPDGSDVEHAVATYDYIISKYGTTNYPDFINRCDSDSGSTILHGRIGNVSDRFNLISNSEDFTSTIITIIASSVSLLSITALSILLVKKRSSNRKED